VPLTLRSLAAAPSTDHNRAAVPNIEDPGSAQAVTASPAPSRLTPLITVAICTHNRADLLCRAAHSVGEQMTADTELLIVDNAGSETTQAIASSIAPAAGLVTYLREEEVGLSAARNAALKAARGRWVLFLDDDAEVLPGWLEGYRGFIAELPDPRIAAVGGPVIPRLEAAPPRWMAAGTFALDRGERARPLAARGGPWGCNIGYDRTVALAAGGFSRLLGHQGQRFGAHEETDLNARLERDGLAIWWLPAARVRHRVAASRLKLSTLCHEQFAVGRCAALMRLGAVTGRWRRFCYVLGRLLAAPPHALVLALVAFATSPFPPRRLSAQSTIFAYRQVGIAWQMALALPRIFARRSATATESAR